MKIRTFYTEIQTAESFKIRLSSHTSFLNWPLPQLSFLFWIVHIMQKNSPGYSKRPGSLWQAKDTPKRPSTWGLQAFSLCLRAYLCPQVREPELKNLYRLLSPVFSKTFADSTLVNFCRLALYREHHNNPVWNLLPLVASIFFFVIQTVFFSFKCKLTYNVNLE